MLNVGQKVSELRRMTAGELRREYAEVFGEQSRCYLKEFLIRRIAGRMQANAMSRSRPKDGSPGSPASLAGTSI